MRLLIRLSTIASRTTYGDLSLMGKVFLFWN